VSDALTGSLTQTLQSKVSVSGAIRAAQGNIRTSKRRRPLLRTATLLQCQMDLGQRDFLRAMIRITSTTTPKAIEISSQDMLATPVYRFCRSALDQALFFSRTCFAQQVSGQPLPIRYLQSAKNCAV